MFRVLFLLLIVMSSAAFAQTIDLPKAVKVDEFERATNGYVKMKMDYFYTELNNNPAAQGVVINYGTDREIRIRERQLRVSIQWRKFDASRITLVNGGFRENVKSELWMVPPGAENPVPSPTAKKYDEFEKIPDGDLRARLQSFYSSLTNYRNDPKLQFFNSSSTDNQDLKGAILIYGSPKSIARQKARISRFIENYKYDSAKITFKDAGFNKGERTEFWLLPAKDKKETKTKLLIVPPGAKPPTQ